MQITGLPRAVAAAGLCVLFCAEPGRTAESRFDHSAAKPLIYQWDKLDELQAEFQALRKEFQPNRRRLEEMRDNYNDPDDPDLGANNMPAATPTNAPATSPVTNLLPFISLKPPVSFYWAPNYPPTGRRIDSPGGSSDVGNPFGPMLARHGNNNLRLRGPNGVRTVEFR